METKSDMPWPERRRQPSRQAARKREAVLRVAARMFQEQGFERTTLASLADALNITKPTVYYYFDSKEQLLVEIFRRAQESALEMLRQADRLETTGIEKLRKALLGYSQIATSDFGRCLINLLQRQTLDLDPATRTEIDGRIREAERLLCGMIETGISDGSIRPLHVKLLYLTIFTGLNGLAAWFRPGESLSESEVAGVQLDVLLKGIAGPGRRPAP
jgi:AcrR family transcriptional regulator